MLSLKLQVWEFHLVIWQTRLRQIILLKCMPHIQHDYFSSFNQRDHCFLMLPLLLPSFLLKLSIDRWQDCTSWISGTGQLPIHFMYFQRHNHSILTLSNSSKAFSNPCFHMATSPSPTPCNLPLTYWKSLKYTTETSNN